MKKLTYLFVACMVSLVVASCGGGSNSSDADRIAQLEDSIARMNSRTESTPKTYNSDYNETEYQQPQSSESKYSDNSAKNESGYVGVYEITDNFGSPIIVNVNADETATLNYAGEEYYGSWEKSSKYDFVIDFPWEGQPYIEFPSGKELVVALCVDENLAYDGRANLEAKNPKKRLPIKKIK